MASKIDNKWLIHTAFNEVVSASQEREMVMTLTKFFNIYCALFFLKEIYF